MCKTRILGFLPVLALLLNAGCLHRTERITIHPDGSAKFETVIKGDPADVHQGDAMPSADSGWQVNDQTEVKENGSETLTRTATLEAPTGGPLPFSYAPKGSRLERLALQFPTKLTIEKRDKGTYYHFERVYRPRHYAQVNYPKQQILEDGQTKKLLAQGRDKWTAETQKVIARKFILMEKLKTAALIDEAASGLLERIPQDTFLMARQRALEPYDDEDLLTDVMALVVVQDAHTDSEAKRIETEILKQVRHALEATLSESGVAKDVVKAFLDRYDFARESFAISEDLGDERWRVVVELPGRIVGHNSATQSAKAAAPKAGGADAAIEGQVVWEFKGDALQDRDVVLMATSFVPKGAE